MPNKVNVNNKSNKSRVDYLEKRVQKLNQALKAEKVKQEIWLKKNKQRHETAYAFSFSRFFITKYLMGNGKTAQYIFNRSFRDANFMTNFLLNNKNSNIIWYKFMEYLSQDDLKTFGLHNAFHELEYNDKTRMFNEKINTSAPVAKPQATPSPPPVKKKAIHPILEKKPQAKPAVSKVSKEQENSTDEKNENE